MNGIVQAALGNVISAIVLGAAGLLATRAWPAARTWVESFRRQPQQIAELIASNQRLERQVHDLQSEVASRLPKLTLDVANLQARQPGAALEDFWRSRGEEQPPH